MHLSLTQRVVLAGGAVAALLLVNTSHVSADQPAIAPSYRSGQPAVQNVDHRWGDGRWYGARFGYGFRDVPRFYEYGHRPGFYQPLPGGGYAYEAPSHYIAPYYPYDFWFDDPWDYGWDRWGEPFGY